MPDDPSEAAAAYALYWAYATGRGVRRDTERAMTVLRASAAAGHPPAQVALGDEIFGASKDEALHWFLAAAAQGDAKGELAAGRMIFHGRFTARDEGRGLALLAQAAAHGNPDAVREHALASRQVEARGRSDDDNLARALDEHGLVDHAATIRALAMPSVRLVAAPRADATIAVGASKLGGAPDVPPGHAWPRRGARSLAFVAQLALEDLQRFAGTELLPADGVLSFFYDAEDQPWGGPDEADGWAVQHHPAAALVRPAGAGAGFAACAIDSFAELTLPPLRSALARSLGDELTDRYGAAVDTLQSVYRRPPRADGEIHRVLGHPDAIQGDMTRRIEYGWRGADLEKPEPTLELAARQWRLLLQVDSDHHAGMMWGDLGRLYFWIRDDDLRARRWDAVRLQLQCS